MEKKIKEKRIFILLMVKLNSFRSIYQKRKLVKHCAYHIFLFCSNFKYCNEVVSELLQPVVDHFMLFSEKKIKNKFLNKLKLLENSNFSL